MNESIQAQTNEVFKDLVLTIINEKTCRVFILLNSIIYFQEPGTGKWLISDRALLYELGPSSEAPVNKIKKATLLDEEERGADHAERRSTFQKTELLSAYLRAIEPKADEEILFMTWDHGSSFGIFRENRPSVSQANLFIPSKGRYPYLDMFLHHRTTVKCPADILQDIKNAHNYAKQDDSGYLTPVEDSTETLRNSELCNAFENWLYEKKIGVLLMMNCFMMNLHTIFCFKDQVNCLVAPQGYIYNYGYNYSEILRTLMSPLSLPTSQKLAQLCIELSVSESAALRMKAFDPERSNLISKTQLFALNLDSVSLKSDVDSIISCLQRIVQGLQNITPETAIKLRTVRQSCFDFSDSFQFIIDITHWISINLEFNRIQIKKHAPSILKDMRQALIQVTNPDFLLEKSDGEFVYSDTNPATATYIPTGIGIFFPLEDFKSINRERLSALRNHLHYDKLLNTKEGLPLWKDLLLQMYPSLEL